MTDYSPWVSRAVRFTRQLNYLPGQWGISVSVAPPLSEKEADDLHDDLPFGLPAPLRAFYVTGSASCRCTYHWSPYDADLARVQKVFPSQRSLYGGARIVPACDLKTAHGIHSWFDPASEEETEEEREAFREALNQVTEMLGESLVQDFRQMISQANENEIELSAEAVQIWRETVPFLDVGNGDYLALHVGGDKRDCPVVYLCHDDPQRPVTEISPSFEKFMSDWEDLCYVGPEIWLLQAFLQENGDGPLLADQAKARRWREIICGQQD